MTLNQSSILLLYSVRLTYFLFFFTLYKGLKGHALLYGKDQCWLVYSRILCKYRIIMLLNTLRPSQNGQYFADNIFKCIFLNEKFWISIEISLKFVPKGPINNKPPLVQIMAWCWTGNKTLSEPMMACLLIHICNTQPQWVNGMMNIWCLLWTLAEMILYHAGSVMLFLSSINFICYNSHTYISCWKYLFAYMSQTIPITGRSIA